MGTLVVPTHGEVIRDVRRPLGVLLGAVACLLLIGCASLANLLIARAVARWDVAAALRESLRGAATTLRGARVRDVLVVTQIGFAVLLTISAALVVRSFAAITRIDPGFRADGVVTMLLAIPRSKYRGDPQVAAVCQTIVDRVRRLPGVRAAGMVNRLPLAGGAQTGGIELERSALASNRLSVDWRAITPDYFRTLGIPLVTGRMFTDADGEGAPAVGIVDDRLARAAWPNENPIGRRFRISFTDAPWMTVVGVVGHIRHDGLTTDPRPQIYWPHQQLAQDRMALVVRGDASTMTEAGGDADALARMVVAEIRAVDPEQPVYDVRTMSAVVDRSLAQQWLTTAVLAAFALVALVLASIGVYGVVSYGVRQRAREFGIRMALGAARRDVLLLVLRRGGALVGCGLSIGVIAALIATRALEHLLYGVSTTDWLSFAIAATVLGATALVATLVPARRAITLDPTTVLRAE